MVILTIVYLNSLLLISSLIIIIVTVSFAYVLGSTPILALWELTCGPR